MEIPHISVSVTFTCFRYWKTLLKLDRFFLLQFKLTASYGESYSSKTWRTNHYLPLFSTILYTVKYCIPILYFFPVICLLPYFYSIFFNLTPCFWDLWSLSLSSCWMFKTKIPVFSLSVPRAIKFFVPSHCWTEQKD